jgi:hypothetical protein
VRLWYLVEPLVTRGTEPRKQQNDQSETVHLHAGRVETRLADVTGQQRGKQIAVEAAARALAGLFRWYRDRKPFPALGAAAFEHVAPPGRCHPGKKTMRALAPAIVGLISPFHGSRPTPVPKLVLRLSPAIECCSQAECSERRGPRLVYLTIRHRLGQAPSHKSSSTAGID